MTEFDIRRARTADLPSIVALLADDELGSTREDISTPLNPRYVTAFESIDSDPNQMLMVADADGTIIGCLQLTLIPGLSRKGMLRGLIESVRVSAAHRSEGIGRKMFEWAIEESRRQGCGLVQLTTDKTRADAHRFYDSLGFVASHEGMKLALQ